MLHFSLIFIAIHSIIILSQPDLYQIITYFLYSLVHSIVNLNKDRGKAEHKKNTKIYSKPTWLFFRVFCECLSVGLWILMEWICYRLLWTVWSWQSLYDLSPRLFSTSIVRSNVHCFALLNAGWAKAQYMSNFAITDTNSKTHLSTDIFSTHEMIIMTDYDMFLRVQKFS